MLVYTFSYISFYIFFWIRMPKRCIRKLQNLKEHLIYSQKKYKIKGRTNLRKKGTTNIKLETSQNCKETCHNLFRSNNYGKYTGGFYIHYHSEALHVLSFSCLLGLKRKQTKALKNLLFLQYSIQDQKTPVMMNFDWWTNKWLMLTLWLKHVLLWNLHEPKRNSYSIKCG